VENYRTCTIPRVSNCATLTCSVVDPDLYGSALILVSWIKIRRMRIRIQKGINDPQKSEEILCFEVLNVKAAGFSCGCFHVLHGGQGIKNIAIFDQQSLLFKILQFLVIKTLDPDPNPILPECWIRDPAWKPMRIQNTANFFTLSRKADRDSLSPVPASFVLSSRGNTLLRDANNYTYRVHQAALWNRNWNRRNRNFLANGTGTVINYGSGTGTRYKILKLCICLPSFNIFFIHILL
jgi:hypothetical protein